MKIGKKIYMNSCVICILFFGTLQAISSNSIARLDASSVSSLRDSSQRQRIRAITIPSSDITLSYVQPGRIAKVHFVEGQWVKAGQVLVQQDDSVEQIQLAQLRAASEDTTQIQASEASLAQKKVDLEKIQKAAAQNAATELEVQHAELSVTMAALSLKLARFEHEQDIRKYDEVKVQVEKMRLVSPIDGRIEKIHVDRDIGLTLHIGHSIKTIKLGYDNYITKYERLRKILGYLKIKPGFSDLELVDLNNPNRIVIHPTVSKPPVDPYKEV